jgi:hypothetical protein
LEVLCLANSYLPAKIIFGLYYLYSRIRPERRAAYNISKKVNIGHDKVSRGSFDIKSPAQCGLQGG